MLWAAAHRLHRGPKITPPRQQLPTPRQKGGGRQATAVVDHLWLADRAVSQHAGPNRITIAAHYRMGGAQRPRFFRKQRGVNATKDRPGASGPHRSADFIAAQRVAGMNPDADHIASADGFRRKWRENLVAQNRIAVVGRGRGGQDV